MKYLGVFCAAALVSFIFTNVLSTQASGQTSSLDSGGAETLLAKAELSNDLVIRDAQELGPETGFPMPRYVSLKSNLVNLRSGPGFRYPVDWVFQRKLLPVIVIEEFEHWRQIRTHDGIVGWLHKSMITGTRTFRVLRTSKTLKIKPARDGDDLAILEPGVVGKLKKCEPSWCRVEVPHPDLNTLSGWIQKRDLFGVGPSEVFRR